MSLRKLIRGVSFFLVVVIVATSAPANQTGTARAAVPADSELVQAPQLEQAGAAPLPGLDIASNQTGLPEWLDAEDVPPPVLTLTASPFQVLPGDVITYSVTITNVADVSLTSTVLSSTLPAGVVYVAQSGVGFDYSPRDQRLTWAIDLLEPGQGLHGRFQLRATGLRMGELITNTVSAASASAPPVSASAVVELAPPRQNWAWATPGEGAWLRSEDGRVDLRVPAGAVEGRTEVSYSPASLTLPEHILFAFYLEARDESGQAVTQFEQPLAMSAFFDLRQLPPGALWRLALFHLEESSGEWQIVPGEVDPYWRRLVASVEHFSAYALGLDAAETAPNFAVDRMSAVRGAQTSAYSRSIAYGYGFDLPPGRGGLTPLLGLSYSSANHSQHQGHYSYVGHGWGLPGADYVQRDPSSGKTILVLGGQSYTLQPYSNGWFVKENPLIKVAFDRHRDDFLGQPNWARWIVTTPDGVVYTFFGQVSRNGESLVYDNPMTFFWGCTPQGNGGEWRELKWERIPLTQIEDRHGNRIKYTWGYEQNIGWTTMPYGCYPAIQGMQRHIRAVRLTGISYNSDLNRVTLTYDSRRDRPAGYDSSNTWRFFTDRRLSSVGVQAVWSGQLSPTTLRTYVLSYADQGTSPYLSQVALNLSYVEQQAGSRSLRTAFAYSSDPPLAWPCSYQHLTRVQNAFGGTVEFTATGSAGSQTCSSETDWRPPAVLTRTERDGITNRVATWHYDGATWRDDAHGFARVWVTAPDGQSCRIHEFAQMTEIAPGQWRDHLAGREKKTTLCTACAAGGVCVTGGELARRETDWSHNSASLPLADYSALPEQDRPRFVWAAEQRSYESRFNDNGTLAAAGVPIQRTTYEYQAARQLGNLSGARQFGNLTLIKEYQGTASGFEDAPLRANVMQYRPNESAWVTSRPAITQLYAGNETTLVAEARLYYDGNSSHTASPSQGLLTKQETMAVLNGAYQSNPASRAKTFQYYANGNLQWARDEFGQQTTFFYDGWYQAHPVCQVNPLGHQAKTTYYGVPGDGICNTTNGSTASVFNRFGQPEKQWDANNALSEYRYDDLGWMTSMAAAPDLIGAATVSYEFRSLSGIGANQPFWLHQQQRDSSGGDNTLHIWTYYDGFGRVLQTKAEADSEGSTARHIETSFDYTWRDGIWREGVPRFVNGGVAVAGASAPAYNPPNWAAADQYETVHTYDRQGRVSAKTLPSGAQVRQYYNVIPDAQNRSYAGLAVIDQASRQTITQTDPFGRLVVAKQYTGSYSGNPGWNDADYSRVTHAYDAADRLLTTTGPDPDGAGPMPRPITTITYDSFGQKASMVDPDMGEWQYRWDLAGNLRKQRDARNVMTCFHYDSLNRLVGKTFHPDTVDPASVNCSQQPTPYPVAYSYDAGPNGQGRRTSMVDPSGNTTWEYDARGRVTKETRAISGASGSPFVTRWTSYDSMNRVRVMQYPDGEGVTFTYTTQGPVKTVYGSNTYYVGDTLYNALGQATDRYLGSTAGLIRQRYTYLASENFRLTALQSGVASAYADLQNLSYSYDAVGNVVSIVDAAISGGSQTQTFAYDALHRLTRGFTSGNMSGWYDEDYTYDAGGNLTTKGKPNSLWWNYGYGQQAPDCPQGALSKPHAVVSADAAPYFNRYCYDQNGNMVRRRLGTAEVLPRASAGGEGQSYPDTQIVDTYLLAYDYENRLQEVSLNGDVVATYTYDGDGNRVKAVVGGVTTIYVGNYYERAGNTVRKYYYAGDVRVAMRTGGQTYYLLSDHLGGTNITTNSIGTLLASLLYKPWGETRLSTGTTPTTWRFTGQREDATIGLYFFNARYLDPQLGRFVQPDTIVPDPGDPQSLNRYSYVLNNPLRYTDPTGMFSEDEIEQFLRDQYGDLWQDYWNAWRSDGIFWNMLLAAQYGDVLWAPTSGLDPGVFGHSGATFRLHGEHDLYEYQGVGPYFLNEDPGTTYAGHPLDGSGVVNQRWEQPQYEYTSGKAPRYTGYNRVVRYGLVGAWFSITEGSGMPYIVGLGAQAWRKLATRVPSILCTPCTTYLTGLTAVMAVNNAVLLEYTMGVEYRSVRDPSDRLETWYQLLYPVLTAQPS